MIVAGVALVIGLTLLGQMIPRFLLAFVREECWRRGERRRRRFAEGAEGWGRVRPFGHTQGGWLTSSPGRGSGITPRGSFTVKQDLGTFRSLSDESGNALPSTLTLLSLVGIAYVGFVILKAVL